MVLTQERSSIKEFNTNDQTEDDLNDRSHNYMSMTLPHIQSEFHTCEFTQPVSSSSHESPQG